MTVYTGATAKTYFALTDHLRSVHAMVDESGTIVEQYRMDAWGRTTVYDGNGVSLTQSAIGNRYVWQGREISWVTGLYHFRLRTYDPVTGRFLSNDPIGIAGGLNQYVFCGNNPVNFRDPFGLCEDATLELDYDMAFRANQYDWYYLAMVHFSMDNQRFDPGGAGEVARNRLIPWAGGYARGDQWGNRQAGRELTGAYGGVVALLMLEVMGPVYANNCISLDETAGSLEDNIIGIGQAFREHPVHSTAMSIGITSVVLAIPSAVVNQVSDRLGNWWGSR
jgi:RHS repeat-associated protein